MSTASTFLQIDECTSICGLFSASNVSALVAASKSILYLCPDCDNDCGYEDEAGSTNTGYHSLVQQKIFQATENVKFDMNKLPFKQTDGSTSILHDIYSYELYKRTESAIDSMPTPLLITCKSNRRAGAVYSLYKCIKNNHSYDEMIEQATAAGFSFIGSDPLLKWMRSVISFHAYLKITAAVGSSLMVRQLFEKETSTYTYILYCSKTKEGIIIDPVIETVDRDATVIRKLGIVLKYVLNTHVHADHVSGSMELKKLFPGCQSVISELSTATADVKVNEGDVITFGNRHIKCLSTPGHTGGCFSYIADDFSCIFTGDALLIDGCGRCDFQAGSATVLYSSIHDKLFHLPGAAVVYPGHDYKGLTQSTIIEEKTNNPRLALSLEGYIALMDGLNLPYPKRIDDAVPANMKCGVF